MNLEDEVLYLHVRLAELSAELSTLLALMLKNSNSPDAGDEGMGRAFLDKRNEMMNAFLATMKADRPELAERIAVEVQSSSRKFPYDVAPL